MSKSLPKLVLSSSRDIPFSQLVLSQKNVRRIKSGLSIEELAEDIARRTLLQSLNVRAMLDDDGNPTGLFEVPAGGRRYRALELLVKTRRMAKDQPVPCIIREAGIAEEDSLAENVMRVSLHPLDQFRAFSALADKGLSEEDIAARFFVPASTVRQRLKLVSVSPKLLDCYGEDRMTLEQLMAFSVNANQARQEQVWEQVGQASHASAYQIRRLLTEDAIPCSDRRARFIGIDAYVAAGGHVMRDLFSAADDGWLQDAALVEQLVCLKLEQTAVELKAEGWKWVEAAVDLPFGCENGKRRIAGAPPVLTEEEQIRITTLTAQYEALAQMHEETIDLPEDIEQQLLSLDGEIALLSHRPLIYEAADMAKAGVFVSLAWDGTVRIDKGYVRPEDEAGIDPQAGEGLEAQAQHAQPVRIETAPSADEEDTAIRPLPDRLVSELTATRTVALRDTLATQPQTAFLALLHALCLSAFALDKRASCIGIGVQQVWLGEAAPKLRETVWSKRIQQRHEDWQQRLPDALDDLWTFLAALAARDQLDLLGHCVSLGVNALSDTSKDHHAGPGMKAQRITAADLLAREVGLDMAQEGWVPTVDNYLGQVTKAQILEAVGDAKGQDAVSRIAHLKKPDMAHEAEQLLAGTGWLPLPLRLPSTSPVLAENHQFAHDDADLDDAPSADLPE